MRKRDGMRKRSAGITEQKDQERQSQSGQRDARSGSDELQQERQEEKQHRSGEDGRQQR